MTGPRTPADIRAGMLMLPCRLCQRAVLLLQATPADGRVYVCRACRQRHQLRRKP